MRLKVTFIYEYKHTKYLFEVEKNVFSHPFSRVPFALNFSHSSACRFRACRGSHRLAASELAEEESTSGEWTPAFTFVFKQPLSSGLLHRPGFPEDYADVYEAENAQRHYHYGLESPYYQRVGRAFRLSDSVKRQGKHHRDIPRPEAAVRRNSHAE